ncbi:MAG: hypothetical protein K0R36_2120 [Chryseobacterium sp.]|jgi:hypothetical protein|nr:hypothetical protein [Chryseobacterium sp.]
MYVQASLYAKDILVRKKPSQKKAKNTNDEKIFRTKRILKNIKSKYIII